MPNIGQLTSKDVLTEPTKLPNSNAAQRLAHLVGLDEHVATLTRDLSLIFDPQLVEDWSQECYGRQLPVIEWARDVVPLIVFQGDVGTGKTELAETIGHRVAEQGGFGIHLVKMNTQVRGTGYVGEMGTLIAESFKAVERLWQKEAEPVLFVIDEADSVLTNRAFERHHHEDKSGVNTILQHLDRFRDGKAQVAVIAITNRSHVLDPALRRRATSVLTFTRPSVEGITALIRKLFRGALTDSDFDALAHAAATHCNNAGKVPLTYSDITLRFAIPALREAVWQREKLNADALVNALEALEPTPRVEFGESARSKRCPG